MTILYDGGERFAETYGDDRWLTERGIAWHPHAERLAALLGASGAIDRRAP